APADPALLQRRVEPVRAGTATRGRPGRAHPACRRGRWHPDYPAGAAATMKARGFTLIEVMVALFVIALGVGALLTTLLASADMVGYLREKSLAQWIALNRVSELRLSNSRPEPGLASDTVEFAGGNWRREQEISDSGIEGLLRIDV